jgi:hypothetical protein
VIEEHAAGRQERHASRGTLEELCSEFVFESADLSTHRGLRDVKALGGAPHISLLGDGDEIADLGKAHGV